MDKSEKLKEKLKASILELENSSQEYIEGFVKNWFIKTNHYKKDELSPILVDFWTSDIPLKYFSIFKNRYYFDAFVFAYFYNSANRNNSFLQAFVENDCLIDLIRILKISKGFLMEEHWDSLQFLQMKSSVKRDFQELNFIRKYLTNWEEHAVEYRQRLLKVSEEDLIIQTLSYFEFFKRYSTKTIDNKSQQTAYETQFISVLNDLLNYKKDSRLEGIDKVSVQYNTEEFIRKTKKELPPKRPMDTFGDENYRPDEKISPIKKEVRELIDFFMQKEIQTYQIENYLSGFSEFEYKDDEDLEADLTINKTRYKNYRKVLERGVYEENYFISKIANDEIRKSEILNQEDMWDREFQLQIEKAHAYFDFLSLPKNIKLKRLEHNIDTKKVLLLLYSFSNLFSPQGRLGATDGAQTRVMRRSIQDNFKAIFESEYLICYDYDTFIQKSAEYFKWKPEETKDIIDYLIADLDSDRTFNINLLTRPIIKTGNKIIWLSSFLKDRKWEILLHKRIVSEQVKNYDGSEHASAMEESIASLFRSEDFAAIASHKYTGGEFDTLAFKDKTLFIIELKSTHIEEDILANVKYETLKLNSHAGYQIERGLKYIEDNFEEIVRIPELNIKFKIEEIEIKPLIVSNIFLGDGQLFKHGHPKISFLELAVILKNDLSDLYMSKQSILTHGNDMKISYNTWLAMNDQSHVNQNISEPDPTEYSLRSDSDSCSAQDLISAIESNVVWKFQRNPFLGDLVETHLKPWNGESIV